MDEMYSRKIHVKVAHYNIFLTLSFSSSNNFIRASRIFLPVSSRSAEDGEEILKFATTIIRLHEISQRHRVYPRLRHHSPWENPRSLLSHPATQVRSPRVLGCQHQCSPNHPVGPPSHPPCRLKIRQSWQHHPATQVRAPRLIPQSPPPIR